MSPRDDLLKQIPNLRAFALSLCRDRDRSDDLVQETLMKAWSNLDRYEVGTNLRAWLFTILRNTYYSECRKGRREVQDPDGLILASLSSHPEQTGHMDMRDFVRALNTLPDVQREALILVGAVGFSYEDVGKICNCAVGTVKSRVNRARCHLTKLLSIKSTSDFGPDARQALPAEFRSRGGVAE